MRQFWGTVGGFPYFTRKTLTRFIRVFKPSTYNRLFGGLGPSLPQLARPSSVGERMYRLAKVMSFRNPEELYRYLVSYWEFPTEVVLNAMEPPTLLTQSSDWAHLADIAQRMMALDLVTYLPDDILAKVDRASMGVSLEARVPILDHRVVEFAARVPISMKLRSGQGKLLLRQVLYRYVPRELVERPKMGFSVPIEDWLRGPLRDWAEGLLNQDRLRKMGYFRPERIRELWVEHLSGQRNWQGRLWNVLMFQAWQEKSSISS